MKISNRLKITLFAFLIILNILLRIQIQPREIGVDSFLMHIMVNSLSEYGYARWILDPLSLIGLYPASYASAMHFFISGASQSMGLDNESIIFYYCVIIGILSMFFAYLMIGEIVVSDDLSKILAAFVFSTSSALIGYSTWTIPTRGFFIVLVPLLIFLLLKCRKSIKYVPLTIFFAILLFSTHHLFYFLIPAFFSFFILIHHDRFNKYILRISDKFVPVLVILSFCIMFLIPFMTGKFIETSRYSSFFLDYVRYIGIFIIPALGGLFYLIFKPKKSFGESFLLLTLIFTTMFIYQQTYLKMFIPIFLTPLVCIGLINIVKLSYKKHFKSLFVIFLLMAVTFSGYYQLIHNYDESPYNKRYMEETTYNTGKWIKNNMNGHGISNDVLFGNRIFAISDTTHILTDSSINNQIHGFIRINISDYNRYPLKSEDFWLTGYEGPDVGQKTWENVHDLIRSPNDFNITFFVENTKANGNLIWNHKAESSGLLYKTYDEGYKIYDIGNARIWKLE